MRLVWFLFPFVITLPLSAGEIVLLFPGPSLQEEKTQMSHHQVKLIFQTDFGCFPKSQHRLVSTPFYLPPLSFTWRSDNSPSLLSEYAFFLKADGILYTITDIPALHDWMHSCLQQHPLFEEIPHSEWVHLAPSDVQSDFVDWSLYFSLVLSISLSIAKGLSLVATNLFGTHHASPRIWIISISGSGRVHPTCTRRVRGGQ